MPTGACPKYRARPPHRCRAIIGGADPGATGRSVFGVSLAGLLRLARNNRRGLTAGSLLEALPHGGCRGLRPRRLPMRRMFPKRHESRRCLWSVRRRARANATQIEDLESGPQEHAWPENRPAISSVVRRSFPKMLKVNEFVDPGMADWPDQHDGGDGRGSSRGKSGQRLGCKDIADLRCRRICPLGDQDRRGSAGRLGDGRLRT